MKKAGGEEIPEFGGSGLRGLERLRDPEAFVRAAKHMASLPDRERYPRSELLLPALLLRQCGSLEEYYAPHNEIVNDRAQVVIAGLTPGWRQMEIALRTMRGALLEGRDAPEACLMAKREARFAGSMRRDLLAMLERLGLPDKLQEREAALRKAGIADGISLPPADPDAGESPQPDKRPAGAEDAGRGAEPGDKRPQSPPLPPHAAPLTGLDHPLQSQPLPPHAAPLTVLKHPPQSQPSQPHAAPLTVLDHPLVHTTSVLPCPVFMEGAKLLGHRPPLGRSAFLMAIMSAHMGWELSRLQKPLVIPLGRAVEDTLRLLAADGLIEEESILWGFPHPSGANGRRHDQFEAALPGMSARLERFFAASDR